MEFCKSDLLDSMKIAVRLMAMLSRISTIILSAALIVSEKA